MALFQKDIAEIQTKLQGVIGKKAWGVERGVGPFVEVVFGQPIPVLATSDICSKNRAESSTVSSSMAICLLERWSGKGPESVIGGALLERISEVASTMVNLPFKLHLRVKRYAHYIREFVR